MCLIQLNYESSQLSLATVADYCAAKYPVVLFQLSPSQASEALLEGSTTKYLPLDDGNENQAESDPLPPPATPLQAALRDASSGHETDTEDSGDDDDDVPARKDPNYVRLQLQDEPIAGAAAVKPKSKSKFKLFKSKKEQKESDDVTYVQVSASRPKHHSAPLQQGTQ